jgi:hypothetical protein
MRLSSRSSLELERERGVHPSGHVQHTRGFFFFFFFFFFFSSSGFKCYSLVAVLRDKMTISLILARRFQYFHPHFAQAG